MKAIEIEKRTPTAKNSLVITNMIKNTGSDDLWLWEAKLALLNMVSEHLEKRLKCALQV